jgi:hypothetical protein
MDPLDVLLGAYFNQDFDLISGTPHEVLRDFATSEGEEAVKGAQRGLADMLSRHSSDENLLAEALERGCEYLPGVPGELRRFFEAAAREWPPPYPPVEPVVLFLREFLDADLAGAWEGPAHAAVRFTVQGVPDVRAARNRLGDLLLIADDEQLEARARDLGWGGLPPRPARLRSWLLDVVTVWDRFLQEHCTSA